jgi:hypothetical protein
VLLEDDGGGFCMLLVDFAIGGGDCRYKSIDIGHDVSPSVWMVGLLKLSDVDLGPSPTRSVALNHLIVEAARQADLLFLCAADGEIAVITSGARLQM